MMATSYLATDAAWWFAAGLWGMCCLVCVLLAVQEMRWHQQDAAERARLRAEEIRLREAMRGSNLR